MRELKFRCFYRGQMLQVEELCFYDDGSVYVYKAVHPEDDHIGFILDQEHVKGVMQFTGLLDKNGKEIYEGDVVRHRKTSRPEYIGKVFYADVRCAFAVKSLDGNYEDLAKCTWSEADGYCITNPQSDKDERMEVIGNVHENPELL